MNRQYHYQVSYKNSKRLLQNLQHTAGDYFILPHPVGSAHFTKINMVVKIIKPFELLIIDAVS